MVVFLVINLNNQNLVLKGYYQGKTNEWKLFPYYDKSKNKSIVQSTKAIVSAQETKWTMNYLRICKSFKNSPAPDPTEFNPDQLED
jgi:hypothetical protein